MDDKQEINNQARELARKELKRRALVELTRRFSEEQEQQPKDESFGEKLPRNIVSGLAQLGHKTLNMPYDIVRGIENMFPNAQRTQPAGLSGFDAPEKDQSPLSSRIPKQMPYDFAQMLGQKGKGTLSDRAIQGVIEYLPEIVGTYGLVRTGLRAAPSLTTRRGANLLNRAEEIAGNRAVHLSPELERRARRFLPRSEASNEMLTRALEGEYAPTFSTQSQIGHHARALEKSPLAAERLRAPVAHELKQSIAQDMMRQLEDHGLPEASDYLSRGLNEFRRTKQLQEALVKTAKYLGIPTTVGGSAYTGYKLGRKALKD